MSEITKEVKEANALELDLQHYIDSIHKTASEGKNYITFYGPFKAGQLGQLKESLTKLGFSVDVWGDNAEVSWK